MKNQYFADHNDYFKYDLLVFLAECLPGIKRLSIIWMLTEGDGSRDGGRIKYIKGAGDRGLFQFLNQSLTEGTRRVARIDDYFKAAGHKFDFFSYGADRLLRNQDRESYFAQIPRSNLESAVVFLDPDNGLEVRSATGRNLQKYLKFEEVQSSFNRMSPNSCLVLYQHLPRIDRKFFLYGLYRDLKDCLNCPLPVSITDNQVAFLILTKEKDRREEVKGFLNEYVRSNLQILD